MPTRLKNTAVLILTLVVIATLVAGCPISPSSGDGSIGTRVGNMAPDFTLTTLDGEVVSLSDLLGRPVMINFWASWCGPCRDEMPDIQAVYDERLVTTPSLVILTINVGEPSAVALKFMQDNNYSFTVLLDSQRSVAIDYDVTGFPTTFFINKDGIIEERRLGRFPDKASIDRGLGQITDE